MIFFKKKSLFLAFLMFFISGIGIKAQTSNVWDGTSNTDWFDEGATEFEIATAEQLAGLANLVNEGNDFSGKTVKLVADIILNDTTNWDMWNEATEGLNIWQPIDGFSGCFDGQGYHIQGAYVHSDNFSIGFFGEIRFDASVRNLGIVNSCFIGNGTYIGSVVGYNLGEISQCYSQDVIIYGDDWTCIGGIAGYDNGPIKRCFNTGTLNGTDYIGGIVGVAGVGGEIEDCFNIGLIYGSDINKIGGIIGSTNGTVRNCYYSGSMPAIVNNKGVSIAVERKTLEDFASGDVCWLLNNQSADEPKWFQTLGYDKYPMFDSKHETVFASGICPNSLIYNNDGFLEIGEHQDDNEDYSCDYCQTIMLYKPVMSDGVYQISNVGELYWFAGLVNGTLVDGTEQNSEAHAVLTADITINKDLLKNEAELQEETDHLLSWIPIGLSSNHTYGGVFDGQGHTISGVFIKTDQPNQGLFGYVGSAAWEPGKIRNLIINDSYIYGSDCVGALVGTISSDGGIIENIGIVQSKITGIKEVGGIVGSVKDGIIRNCYNWGSVKGNYNIGGIVGSNEYEVSNCYYWDLCGASGDGKAKKADEFSSGAVCWLLNGQNSDSPVWFQTLGVDKYPLMNKNHGVVYVSGPCPGKPTDYNNIANDMGEHADDNEDYVCDYCKSVFLSEPLMLSDIYQISNVGELYWFAGLVNGTLSDGTEQNTKAHAVLVEDIVVNQNFLTENGEISNEVDIETLIPWTPIGDSNNPFLGSFDGQNHKISGLYINGGNYLGLFGHLDYHYVNEEIETKIIGCVKNLTLSNSYIKGNNYIGGIVGSNNAILNNLASIENVIEGNERIGGISGSNNNIILDDIEITAISDVSVSGYPVKGNDYVGGIVGFNNGTIDHALNNSAVLVGSNDWTLESGGGIAGFSRGFIKNSSNKGNIVGLYKGLCIGGIVGLDENSSEISCCVNRGDICGDVGCVSGGISAETYGIIENCFNVASVTNIDNEYEVTTCGGGISGLTRSSGIVRNCYNIGTVKGGYWIGSISGEADGASFVNCYYLNTSAPTGIGNEENSELVTVKTLDDFISGSVAHLLQGGQDDPTQVVWGQKLKGEAKDIYPILTSDAVACVYDADIYYDASQVVSTYVNPGFLSGVTTNAIAVINDKYFIPVKDCRNIVVKDGEEYVCDSLELVDGVDFYTPVSFWARKAIYNRLLPSESVWGTVALPFAIANNDDATLYLPDEIIADGVEAGVLVVKPLENLILEPYEPALFHADVAAADLSFHARDVKVPATSEAMLAMPIGNGDYEMIGTMSTIERLEEGDLFIAQNKFWSVGTQKEVGLKAFRAYLTTPEMTSYANVLRIVIDGTTTNIRQESVEKNNILVDVYNATGVLLRRGVCRDKALDNLPVGLYIISGEKVIKK